MTVSGGDIERLIDYVFTMQAHYGRGGEPPYQTIEEEVGAGGRMSRRPVSMPVYLGTRADPLAVRPAPHLRRRALTVGGLTMRPITVTAGSLARAGAHVQGLNRLGVLIWNVWRYDRQGITPPNGWLRADK